MVAIDGSDAVAASPAGAATGAAFSGRAQRPAKKLPAPAPIASATRATISVRGINTSTSGFRSGPVPRESLDVRDDPSNDGVPTLSWAARHQETGPPAVERPNRMKTSASREAA